MEQVHNLVSIPREMFVDQIDSPPLGVGSFIVSLRTTVLVECLVKHIVHINFKRRVETLLLHVLPSVPEELEVIVFSSFSSETSDNLGADQIRLA
jgi:hypothetical protein